MNFFKQQTEITDLSVAPFETYLFISSTSEAVLLAVELDNESPLDLGELLQAFYSDFSVSITDQMGGSNYAAIMTDGRAPDSPIVWASCDFYLESEDC